MDYYILNTNNMIFGGKADLLVTAAYIVSILTIWHMDLDLGMNFGT